MTAELTPAVTLRCRQQRVRAVRFNVDGAYCLTAGDDKKLKLWNPHTALHLKTYGGHADSVLDACGSCDSAHIVSCGGDRSVIMWDVTTAQPLRRYRAHAAAATCVRYNEMSTIAVSGSVDNTVMMWDVGSRRLEPVQVLRDARDTVTCLQIQGYELLTASADGHIRLYDIRMGRVTCDCVGWPVVFVSLTRDGQCLVVSCTDGNIRLYDKDTGELLNTYYGHAAGDFAIENCVDRTDTHIISGSASGEIWIWDLISGGSVRLPQSPGRTVHSLSRHPTQDSLLAASDDTITLWAPPTSDNLS